MWGFKQNTNTGMWEVVHSDERNITYIFDTKLDALEFSMQLNEDQEQYGTTVTSVQ